MNNNRKFRMVGLLIGTLMTLALIMASASMAQETTLGKSLIDRYAGTPHGRTEDGAFVLGDPDAPVTVVEFADFMCPHCQSYKSTIDRLIEDFVLTGKARFEYRMLPAVDPTFSIQTAQLVQCADMLKPGSFFYAHDVMFELTSSTRFGSTTARTFAERVGVEYGALLTCTNDADQVFTDQEVASRNGVQGTPGVMVRYNNGPLQWISGTPSRGAPTYEALAGLIESVNIR